MIALVADDGRRIGLDLHRWQEELSPFEWELVAELPDPVLDVGCGPGRVVATLAAAGRPCLGIDPAPAATRAARRRGATTLTRSVFDPLPGAGRWGAVVLLDGNIGIGGDPDRLLRRAVELLRPGGRVLVELEPPGSTSGCLAVRLEHAGRTTGPWFPWACLAVDRFGSVAEGAGFVGSEVHQRDGRWFGTAGRR